MAGINVLSDTLKVGSKLEKTSTPKGKDVADSPENAATGFAAMLSGSMNQNVDPKGQNSKVGQDLEEKQSAEDSVQSAQNPNGSVSVLGYGNFAFSNLFQPTLQSDLPAGKEANSGNDVGQGTVSLATANVSLTNAKDVAGNNLGSAILNLVSLAADEVPAQSGMTTPKPQGDNPGLTELDKYKQVISNLLEVLSGEITDNSPKGTSLGSASSGTMDLSQDMAKIVQGWMTATNDVAKGGQASSEQMGIQSLIAGLTTAQSSVDPELTAKLSTLLAALNPLLGQETKDAKIPHSLTETPLQQASDVIDTMSKGNASESAVTVAKDSVVLMNSPQKPVEVGLQESKTQKNVAGSSNEVIRKGDPIRPSESFEPSAGKDLQNQNSSVSVGVAGNIVASNVADGKTVATPVWEQISTVIRAQVMNRSQDLKQLDIQLHPADLGKIQIDMRWENGQVHLQVQASQASTGQLLQNHLSDLRQDLSNQGVNCGTLQMGQDGERQQNSHGDESRRTFNQTTNLNKDEDLTPVNTPIILGQDEINRINVTA